MKLFVSHLITRTDHGIEGEQFKATSKFEGLGVKKFVNIVNDYFDE